MNERYFIPSRIYVGNTNIPVSVKHWHWKQGRGMSCYLLDGRETHSEYTLPELLSAIKNNREWAVEVTACPLCKEPCKSPSRIVCEKCEIEQMNQSPVDLKGGGRFA